MHARNPVLPDSRFVLLTILVAGCRGDPDPLAPVVPPAAAAVASTSALTGHIAFVSNRDDGNFEIYSMNADGSNQTNLTNDPRADFQPAWSTDGSKVAFSRVENDGTQHVGVMNADIGLFLPDFRAGERVFQLLTQVAGRPGRQGGGQTIVVVVQG